ncbi:MAG: terpene cyclase/mutase family protein [Bacteroidetes bacterium]|nr:terpene cyclase/mutase family protein [Bacteroidota bacterium]
MKRNNKLAGLFSVIIFCITASGIAAFTLKKETRAAAGKPLAASGTQREHPGAVAEIKTPATPKGCVFKTVFGEEKSDSFFILKTPQKVTTGIAEGLHWMAKAQNNDGGWGAGSHYNQKVMDPHAVQSDPATTAMVAMALLRCQHTPTSGEYASQVNKALNFLIAAVENAPENDLNITSLKGTQPQIKLGENIDVVLTSQFLTNVLDYLGNDAVRANKVKGCIGKCVAKIQRAQSSNGSMRGSGWAGVLQSSFANNALESASQKGVKVEEESLERARQFQKDNFDVNTKTVNTDLGAGVVLYSVSGSARASAAEAREARELVDQAKREGKLKKGDAITADNLQKAGIAPGKAMKLATAYDINVAAADMAQRDEVISGFGNNGGEEFLSFLQTGEGMIIAKDNGWKKWYDNTSGRLLSIQNNDGSWNGHHCITSPVFCTATCLLVLSVNNDVEKLTASK